MIVYSLFSAGSLLNGKCLGPPVVIVTGYVGESTLMKEPSRVAPDHNIGDIIVTTSVVTFAQKYFFIFGFFFPVFGKCWRLRLMCSVDCGKGEYTGL